MKTAKKRDLARIGRDAMSAIQDMVDALLKAREAYDDDPSRENEEAVDAAERAIHEDPLSIEFTYRRVLGTDDEPQLDGFEILLATGGPAVRLVGDFGAYNVPHRVQLQVQDWFTAWTDVSQDTAALDAYLEALGLEAMAES